MKKLRLSNPWRYKAPFLISVPYFMMAVTGLSVADAAWGFGMSCCTILGIAGFGYLLNDYSDREEDQKAGKFNVLVGMKPLWMVLLLAFLLAMAVLPWVFFFPVDAVSGAMLAAEFLLFALYSLPPFRLKERGFAGVLADALYAHAVPALLAAYTFYLLGDKHFDDMVRYLAVLGGWQFFWGMRNILLHQQGDLAKDAATGTRTFGVMVGAKAIRIWLHGMVALEIAGFVAYGLVLSLEWWFSGLLYLTFLLQFWAFRLVFWKIGLPATLRERLSSYLDEFYCGWIPLLPLGLLICSDLWFIPLALLHLLLFPNGLIRLTRHSAGMMGWKIPGG